MNEVNKIGLIVCFFVKNTKKKRFFFVALQMIAIISGNKDIATVITAHLLIINKIPAILRPRKFLQITVQQPGFPAAALKEIVDTNVIRTIKRLRKRNAPEFATKIRTIPNNFQAPSTTLNPNLRTEKDFIEKKRI